LLEVWEVARNKPLAKKLRLINREKSNQPIPVWVTVKTLRKVMRRFRLRNWRRSKLEDV
jgi:large subunit ribosomal protein L39e